MKRLLVRNFSKFTKSKWNKKGRKPLQKQKRHKTSIEKIAPRGFERPLLRGLKPSDVASAQKRPSGWGSPSSSSSSSSSATSFPDQKSLSFKNNVSFANGTVVGVDDFDPRSMHPSPTQQKRTGELFAQPGVFAGAAKDPETCEEVNWGGFPEIAFAGRSNVGKSTLLNALMGTGTLVKTSKVAGKTKGLNFFEVGPKPGTGRDGNMMLVDLPGYGHAKGKKLVQQEIAGRIFAYVLGTGGSTQVRQVFLLIDSRRGPMTVDKLMMKQMDKRGISYRIVLTKCDCISPNDLRVSVAETCEAAKDASCCDPCIHIVSSKDGTGVRELRHAIVRSAFPEADANISADLEALHLAGFTNLTKESLSRQNQEKLRDIWDSYQKQKNS
eukprot:g2578.t1